MCREGRKTIERRSTRTRNADNPVSLHCLRDQHEQLTNSASVCRLPNPRHSDRRIAGPKIPEKEASQAAKRNSQIPSFATSSAWCCRPSPLRSESDPCDSCLPAGDRQPCPCVALSALQIAESRCFAHPEISLDPLQQTASPMLYLLLIGFNSSFASSADRAERRHFRPDNGSR